MRIKENGRLKQEVAQWKRACELLLKSRKVHEDEIKNLKEALDKLQWEHELKVKAEIDAVKGRYKNVIASLKEKNNSLSEVGEEVKEQLKSAEAKISSLAAVVRQNVVKEQQLVLQVERQKEESDRFARLMEMKIKALNLACEAKCENKCEEIKANHELELRNIYAWTANLFKVFCNMRVELNKEGFEWIVQNVADYVCKSREQDSNLRRCLGIQNDASIEEAVSSLLIGACTS
jgi:hypothetical protein